jgi:tetratricopeptide (TPR) repeat protein
MRLVRISLISILAFASFSAPAADQDRHDNDYYTNVNKSILSTVERYHLGPGEEKLNAKHYIAAQADFQFILNYYPNHPRALLLMAELCETWKSPTCDLEQVFNRAVARNPNIATTFVIIGIDQERTKRIPAAIESFKHALAIEPDSVNANYNIALAYLDSGQYDLANEHAQKAYALGAPLPGLRDRLERAGHWQPSQQPAPSSPQGKSTVK